MGKLDKTSLDSKSELQSTSLADAQNLSQETNSQKTLRTKNDNVAFNGQAVDAEAALSGTASPIGPPELAGTNWANNRHDGQANPGNPNSQPREGSESRNSPGLSPKVGDVPSVVPASNQPMGIEPSSTARPREGGVVNKPDGFDNKTTRAAGSGAQVRPDQINVGGPAEARVNELPNVVTRSGAGSDSAAPSGISEHNNARLNGDRAAITNSDVQRSSVPSQQSGDANSIQASSPKIEGGFSQVGFKDQGVSRPPETQTRAPQNLQFTPGDTVATASGGQQTSLERKIPAAQEPTMSRTSVPGETVAAPSPTRSVSTDRGELGSNPARSNSVNSAESPNLGTRNASNPLDGPAQSKPVIASLDAGRPTGTPIDAQGHTMGGAPDAQGRIMGATPDAQGRLTNATPDAQGRMVGAPLDTQARPTGASTSPDAAGRDASARQNSAGNSLDVQGRINPSSTEIKPGGQSAPLDGQGKQAATGASGESFGTRRETGVQLPETKQSSGRTDGGGIANSDPIRQISGRNDANSAKLPDAKTLANLDQKFGDKVNPPGSKGGGLPIALPGVPDIFGGLRGQKDAKDGKEIKGEIQSPKDGKEAKVEVPGTKDGKDVKGELVGSKDSKIDSKTTVVGDKNDTKSGAAASGEKGLSGQKGRSESDTSVKPNDSKPNPDGRSGSSEIKLGPDGRPTDGRQQGGSNLVHDGGSAPGGAHGSKADGAADRGGIDGKTRSELAGAGDRNNVDGKTRTDFTNKVDLGDKPHMDAGAKVAASHGDSPFVLPPGSLPVPDLVGGIKNIGQQLDGRTGKAIQAEDAGKGQGITGKIDATKGDVTKVDAGKTIGLPGKADATKGDAKSGDVKPGDIKLGDARKGDGSITLVTGGTRSGDNKGGDSKPGDPKSVDGVKTIVTGGTKPGDAVKSGSASGVDGSVGEAKVIAGRNPLTGKLEGSLPVPPRIVPFNEMIGNLKAIASRIFPAENRTDRPDIFDKNLPGRKTERLEGDRAQSASGAGPRTEPSIPIIRSLDGAITKTDQQFVVKVPQTTVEASKETSNRIGETAVPGKVLDILAPGKTGSAPLPSKTGDVSSQGRTGDVLVEGKLDDAPAHVKAGDLLSQNQVGDPLAQHKPEDSLAPNETRDELVRKAAPAHPGESRGDIIHDEAAERQLVEFELVGLDDSAAPLEAEEEEEEVFPLAAIEYFGSDFEKSISNEEEVPFDGDGETLSDDEQSTRYQYIVESGDTLEHVAIKVFGNVTLAPLIYEINKDAIPIGMRNGQMVFNLKVGTVIWLPFPREMKDYLAGLSGLTES